MPGAVLQRPEHAMRIAAIAGEWTQIEFSMINLLAGSYGQTLYNESGPYEAQHNPVAVAAMQAAETIRARLKLLDLTLGKMVTGTSVEQEWLAVRDSLQKRARERNKIVHGSWGIMINEPDELVMHTSDGYFKWTVQDFDDVLERLVTLRWAVVDLTNQVTDAVHGGEIPQGIMGPITGWLSDRADGSTEG